MKTGARTPEELETLLEDAFVMQDTGALAELFLAEAVLASRREEAHGERIAALAARMWASKHRFMAEPRRVVQAGDTALVVADSTIGVARRAPDRRWRYAIELLDVDSRPKGSHP
jgi:ketosteroid isomerase-like protein